MISAVIAFGAVVFGFAVWCVVQHFTEHGKHAGAGEGALTVRHLLAQAASEVESGGRHRLHEPTPPHCGMAYALATAETRLLPRIEASAPAEHESTGDPLLLQRILAALRQI
ncbi:hypothetical protein [Saccharopolyspora sp. NPDC002376]